MTPQGSYQSSRLITAPKILVGLHLLLTIFSQNYNLLILQK